MIQLVFCLNSTRLWGQQIKHDWENYVSPLGGRPVSVNVDLGLHDAALGSEYPYVIIARVRILEPDLQGMPDKQEAAELLALEDQMVASLARQNGALFAGRFTQRGIREFYFYAPDTSGYKQALQRVFDAHASYHWLAQAKRDEKWENYHSVLYPSDQDKIRIYSRKRLEEISGQDPKESRFFFVSHYFAFPSSSSREKLLRDPLISGYQVEYMPKDTDQGKANFELVISRRDRPDLPWIEKTVIPLLKAAQSAGGLYKGWDYTNK